MNKEYLNKIILGDCLNHIPNLKDSSIDLFLSDIPYGINLDEWDVLHQNTNSALLGESPAQKGKSGFKRRGKPINGWAQSDRNILRISRMVRKLGKRSLSKNERWRISFCFWCTSNFTSSH